MLCRYGESRAGAHAGGSSGAAERGCAQLDASSVNRGSRRLRQRGEAGSIPIGMTAASADSMQERSATVLSATFFASLLLAACGGSSEPTGSGSLTIEELPDALGQALCQAEQSCNPFYYSVAFTNTDCKALLSRRLEEASLTQVQAAIAAQTVHYDGALAQQCVSAVSSGSCSVLDNHLPEVCRQALTGTVAIGGACDIDSECSGSSRCEIDGSSCPGTCAPLASAGVACGKDSDCAVGLICSTATKHCTTPAALGEGCLGGSAAQCAAGLLCLGNDDAQMRTGTCTTAEATLVKHEGESCDLQHGPWCVSGSSCVVESIKLKDQTLVSSCHALAAAGAECGLGVPPQCPSGQYCPLALTDLISGHLTANCSPLPAEGEPCGPALGFSRCAGNLVCDTSRPLAPVCVSPHSLGQSCSSNELCYSQHCVDGACVPESVCAK